MKENKFRKKKPTSMFHIVNDKKGVFNIKTSERNF